jgi:hypothetical protein
LAEWVRSTRRTKLRRRRASRRLPARRRWPAVRVAPKRPRRTSLDEPIRLLNGASASESNRSNKEHRERQGGLWGRGLGCGRTAHIWSYDPGPITRPQTHILRAFCRLTSPCLAHRRDGDSPAAASKHRPTSACCARRRPPRRLALPCSASITTPGRAPAAPARRTRPGGRTATVERKSEIARGHRARVCGLWSNHCMILAIWTQ